MKATLFVALTIGVRALVLSTAPSQSDLLDAQTWRPSPSTSSQESLDNMAFIPFLVRNDEMPESPTPTATETIALWVRPIPTSKFQLDRTPREGSPNCVVSRFVDDGPDDLIDSIYVTEYDSNGIFTRKSSDLNADGDSGDFGDSEYIVDRNVDEVSGTGTSVEFSFGNGEREPRSISRIVYKDGAIIRHEVDSISNEQSDYLGVYSYDSNGLLVKLEETSDGETTTRNFVHNLAGQKLSEWRGDESDELDGLVTRFHWTDGVVDLVEWIDRGKAIQRNVIVHDDRRRVVSDMLDPDADGPRVANFGAIYEYGENGWASRGSTIRAGALEGFADYTYDQWARLSRIDSNAVAIGVRSRTTYKYSCPR